MLAWLALVKWGLPPGPPRLALFHGGGSLLGLAALWRGEERAALRPLFAAPLWGLAAAVFGFALLMGAAALLLIRPWPGDLLPAPLASLIALFHPGALWAVLLGRTAPPDAPTFLVWAGGSVAEEWMFRVVWFWRWLGPGDPAPGEGTGSGPLPGILKLIAVNAGFAALHLPQPPAELLAAWLGGLALGAALWRWRNFYLIAGLHVLYNGMRLLA